MYTHTMKNIFRGLKKFKNIKTSDVMYNFQTPIPGIEWSVPITLFEKIFTKIHYGHEIEIDNIFIINCMIGITTYGLDRYLDSLDYKKEKDKKYDVIKKNKYEKILKNDFFIKYTIFFSFLYLSFLLYNEGVSEFLPLLFITIIYKKIKNNICFIKSFLIGIMWTFASIILPCVLYDKNYEILIDYKCYLPIFFTLIGSSNLADYFDYNEDKDNGLSTLPIVLGKQNALLFSLFFMIMSSILFINHEYFDRFYLQNILFEINNLSVILIIVRNMDNVKTDKY